MNHLFKQFSKVRTNLKAITDPQYDFYKLELTYKEPHRAYHTFQHINHCIKEFNLVSNLLENPDEVAMALFYHDAVYDVKNHKRDSELESATMAYKDCLNAGISGAHAAKIHDLILLTKHFDEKQIPKTIDEKTLVDIDLAILGRKEKEFNAYEENIRKEYSHVPQDVFDKKRAEVLHAFKERNPLYLTKFFKDCYEKQAKRNISNSLRGIE